MPLTIKRVLLKRRKRDDGTIPIYWRFTENRKSRYRSTGFFIKEKDWDPKVQLVKSSHRRHKHINIQLRRLSREIEEIRDNLEINSKLNMDTLLSELEEDKDPRSIITISDDYRSYLQSLNRYWEQRHFKVVKGNLEAFIKEENKTEQLDRIDAAWIEDFQEFLLNKVGNGNNTVRKKLQRLKGMTDWLFKNNEIRHDPFTKVDKVESQRANNKVKLSIQQITDIEALELERGSNLWHTRNYFMFSFYNAGIRFGDLCCLKWNNLIDGRLVYTMNKTDQQKSIRQQEPMYRILFQYITNPGAYLTFSEWKRGPNYFVMRPIDPLVLLSQTVTKYAADHRDNYIFPVLEKNYNDPMKLRAKISSKNVLTNKWLKVIAEKAGIQANISFHVSRHSFAHYALKKGMDLYSISKALGHSHLKVTEEYIKTFDEELLDESMNSLFK